MRQHYIITVQGHLDQGWSNWFDGMTVTNEANGQGVLTGFVPDQAALHGVLIKIRDLGLPLLSLQSRRPDDDHHRVLSGTEGPTAVSPQM